MLINSNNYVKLKFVYYVAVIADILRGNPIIWVFILKKRRISRALGGAVGFGVRRDKIVLLRLPIFVILLQIRRNAGIAGINSSGLRRLGIRLQRHDGLLHNTPLRTLHFLHTVVAIVIIKIEGIRLQRHFAVLHNILLRIFHSTNLQIRQICD